MRFVAFTSGSRSGVAHQVGERWYDTGYGSLLDIIRGKAAESIAKAAGGAEVDLSKVRLLPPIPTPPKIICVGLNYVDHAAESSFEVPDYPTFFARFATSLVAHGAPMIRPILSEQFDYEGEMVAIVGTGGRHITKDDALKHVFGYSVFNEGSVRDYQFKSPQWTPGKNFDATGAFGPLVVTADELPQGAAGLKIETRLNGKVMQSANTKDLIFSVADLISIASESMTLQPGDVIVTGTPAGVGLARKPPVFLRHGDVCEVEIERIGILRNPIEDEKVKAA